MMPLPYVPLGVPRPLDCRQSSHLIAYEGRLIRINGSRTTSELEPFMEQLDALRTSLHRSIDQRFVVRNN